MATTLFMSSAVEIERQSKVRGNDRQLEKCLTFAYKIPQKLREIK